MLLDRNDIRIDIQDHENQTALSLARSKGHDNIARMISERAAIKSDTADPGDQESLPPSAGDEYEFIEEMQLEENHPNSNTADPSGHLHPHQQTPIHRKGSDYEGYFPGSADSIVLTTRLSNPPQSPPPGASEVLVFFKSNLPPSEQPPTNPPIAVHEDFIPPSFACILDFFLVISSFVTRQYSHFHK